jgi:uncharacterized protein (UPF0335 family)
MTADKQLKAYIDRVLRLKEEQDTIGDDIREIYAEAKAEGYDKTIMGKVVAHLRRELKKGSGAVDEAEMVFDTYLTAYRRASGTPVATHTHEENFDRETGEILETNPRLITQVVDGMQTEAGRAALIAAVDILIEQEEAEEQDPCDGAVAKMETGSVTVTAGETAPQFHAKASDDASEAGRKALGRAEASADAPDGAELVSRGVGDRAPTATSEEMDVTGGESAATTPKVLDGGSPVAGESRHHCDVSEDEAGQTLTGNPIPEIDPPEDRSEDLSLEGVNPVDEGGLDANAGGEDALIDENCDQPSNTVGERINVSPTDGITYEIAPKVGMKYLSYAHCFPELTKAEYQCLAGDITLNGVQEPIVRTGDIIVDGWNRYNAARSLGIEYPVREYDGDDVLLDVISWQRAARSWTPQQERKIATSLSKVVPHRSNDIWQAFDQEPALQKEEVAA